MDIVLIDMTEIMNEIMHSDIVKRLDEYLLYDVTPESLDMGVDVLIDGILKGALSSYNHSMVRMSDVNHILGRVSKVTGRIIDGEKMIVDIVSSVSSLLAIKLSKVHNHRFVEWHGYNDNVGCILTHTSIDSANHYRNNLN